MVGVLDGDGVVVFQDESGIREVDTVLVQVIFGLVGIPLPPHQYLVYAHLVHVPTPTLVHRCRDVAAPLLLERRPTR